MDKLLLTLTLLAFSSGVICNVAQNLTEGDSAADSGLPRTKVLDSHEEFYDSVGCAEQAPSDYIILKNIGAIKLVHQPAVTWNEARKICAADGGQLAVINSQNEANSLQIMQMWMKIDEAWIGIHDQFEHGNWVTLTGESLTATGYDHWSPGQPKYADGNEDCGSLIKTGGFKNLACDHWRSYFCKIKIC